MCALRYGWLKKGFDAVSAATDEYDNRSIFSSYGRIATCQFTAEPPCSERFRNFSESQDPPYAPVFVVRAQATRLGHGETVAAVVLTLSTTPSACR